MEWIDANYGFGKASVGRARLSVGWESIKGDCGYRASVSIAGVETKVLGSRYGAKATIETLLRKMCEQILEELGPAPEGSVGHGSLSLCPSHALAKRTKTPPEEIKP